MSLKKSRLRIWAASEAEGKRLADGVRLGITARMQAFQFEESVASILSRDSSYDGHAYFFLKESLDFTLKRVMEETGGKGRHVSGKELLEGFRDLAIEQFGPMAATLMDEWGVRECRDVGNMVFQLIEEQVFGKQESDKPEDFDGGFDFRKALREPFLPMGRELAGKA
jgi:uncharacterized repeat protein (TIGR04138 family)